MMVWKMIFLFQAPVFSGSSRSSSGVFPQFFLGLPCWIPLYSYSTILPGPTGRSHIQCLFLLHSLVVWQANWRLDFRPFGRWVSWGFFFNWEISTKCPWLKRPSERWKNTAFFHAVSWVWYRLLYNILIYWLSRFRSLYLATSPSNCPLVIRMVELWFISIPEDVLV